MTRLPAILLFGALLLYLSGCGKDKEASSASGKSGDFLSGDNQGGAGDTKQGPSGAKAGTGGSGPPSLTPLKPGKAGTPGTLSRKTDGLWYEDGKSAPYTGTIVHEEDDTTWEEKFANGVRSAVRAWDEDGDRVVLHSWNADGSPKN